MSIVLKNIEDFNIGDAISQSRNTYEVVSKNDKTKRVKVRHVGVGFEGEFEYGSRFVLVREAKHEV